MHSAVCLILLKVCLIPILRYAFPATRYVKMVIMKKKRLRKKKKWPLQTSGLTCRRKKISNITNSDTQISKSHSTTSFSNLDCWWDWVRSQRHVDKNCLYLQVVSNWPGLEDPDRGTRTCLGYTSPFHPSRRRMLYPTRCHSPSFWTNSRHHLEHPNRLDCSCK